MKAEEKGNVALAIVFIIVACMYLFGSNGASAPMPGDPGCENGWWLGNGSAYDTPDWVCP